MTAGDQSRSERRVFEILGPADPDNRCAHCARPLYPINQLQGSGSDATDGWHCWRWWCSACQLLTAPRAGLPAVGGSIGAWVIDNDDGRVLVASGPYTAREDAASVAPSASMPTWVPRGLHIGREDAVSGFVECSCEREPDPPAYDPWADLHRGRRGAAAPDLAARDDVELPEPDDLQALLDQRGVPEEYRARATETIERVIEAAIGLPSAEAAFRRLWERAPSEAAGYPDPERGERRAAGVDVARLLAILSGVTP